MTPSNATARPARIAAGLVGALLVIQPKGKAAKRYQRPQVSWYCRGERPDFGRLMQHRYHINVFWYPDDECWIADVPDLKPCSAHGDTPEEAIAEAQVAIELWMETAKQRGLSIPEARYRPAIYAAA